MSAFGGKADIDQLTRFGPGGEFRGHVCGSRGDVGGTGRQPASYLDVVQAVLVITIWRPVLFLERLEPTNKLRARLLHGCSHVKSPECSIAELAATTPSRKASRCRGHAEPACIRYLRAPCRLSS